MFKIGEFSRLTRLSVRMLRYYDEVSLLKPVRTDRQTGYRFYSASQIPAANRIVMLRDLGCGVEEIRLALNASQQALVDMLNDKRRDVEREMTARLARFDGAIAQIACSGPPPEVNILSVPSYRVLSLRKVIPDYYSEGGQWKELSALARQANVPLSGESFSIYHDPDYREKDVDVELCALIVPGADFVLEYEDLPCGLLRLRETERVEYMASSIVEGPFENIAGGYLALAEYLDGQAQYSIGETSRQWVHVGPWNAQTEEDYRTEIQIPLDIRP